MSRNLKLKQEHADRQLMERNLQTVAVHLDRALLGMPLERGLVQLAIANMTRIVELTGGNEYTSMYRRELLVLRQKLANVDLGLADRNAGSPHLRLVN